MSDRILSGCAVRAALQIEEREHMAFEEWLRTTWPSAYASDPLTRLQNGYAAYHVNTRWEGWLGRAARAMVEVRTYENAQFELEADFGTLRKELATSAAIAPDDPLHDDSDPR